MSFYSLIPYFFESYATGIFLDAESTDIEHYADKIPVLKGLTWTHFDGEAEREQGI